MVLRLDRVTLIPAGDQAPAGRRVAAEYGRLPLVGGGSPEEGCSVPAADAELIETDACGLYLRVERPTLIQAAAGTEVPVEAGLYQVIRRSTA